jgi:hypothetical protein
MHGTYILPRCEAYDADCPAYDLFINTKGFVCRSGYGGLSIPGWEEGCVTCRYGLSFVAPSAIYSGGSYYDATGTIVVQLGNTNPQIVGGQGSGIFLHFEFYNFDVSPNQGAGFLGNRPYSPPYNCSGIIQQYVPGTRYTIGFFNSCDVVSSPAPPKITAIY